MYKRCMVPSNVETIHSIQSQWFAMVCTSRTTTHGIKVAMRANKCNDVDEHVDVCLSSYFVVVAHANAANTFHHWGLEQMSHFGDGQVEEKNARRQRSQAQSPVVKEPPHACTHVYIATKFTIDLCVGLLLRMPLLLCAPFVWNMLPTVEVGPNQSFILSSELWHHHHLILLSCFAPSLIRSQSCCGLQLCKRRRARRISLHCPILCCIRRVRGQVKQGLVAGGA